MAPGAERFDIPPLRIVLVVIVLSLGAAVAALEHRCWWPSVLIVDAIAHTTAGVALVACCCPAAGLLFLDPFLVFSGVGPPILRADFFPPAAVGSATRLDTLVRHDW